MREFKKVIAILLIAVMMLPYSSFAIGVRSDIGNHWAKVDIEYLLGKGVVSGYPDGTFRPDKQITRAEFITIVNSIFGYQDRGLVQFRDVRYGDWFYNEVATAVEAGYISGYVDGTIRPNNPITRQEASKIIGTVFDLEEVELKASEEFKDYFLIGSWAKGHVNALKKKGYLTGYRDGTFRPNNPITRAEAVKIIRNASGTIINTGGVYTSDAYGNVLVNTSNVILRDMDIKGDLYLVEGIGEGDVKLDNVTVEGNTYIRGGDNRITIRDSELGEVVINKKSGNVRVVLEGDTIVENMVIKSGTKLVVEEDAEVEEIEVDAKDVEIEAEGDIDLLIANEDVIVNDEKVKKHKKIAVDDGKVEEVDDRGRRIRDDELESVSISGEAVVGETLRARIRPKDATANYEWQWSNRRNGTYRDIRGADRSRYTLTEEDEGMWIRVKATGRRDYEGTVRSRPVYVEAAEPLPEREVLSKEAMGYDPNKVGAGVVDITGNGQVKITLKTILDETGYGVDNGRLTLDGKNFNYTDADKKASNGWANPQIAYVPVLVNIDKLGGYKDITSVKYDGKSGSVIIDSGKLYINIPVAENSANPASEASVDDWSLLEEAATKVVILAEDSKGNEKEFIFTATTKETLVVPEPEVKGSIAWDPGKTGGENLNVIVEGSTIIFNGQIKWYSEDESLGRIAGNRVGVQITVPEGFDTASTTVKIGNNTYNWSEIEDGEGYFWWYPLITEAGEEFIAEVKWNEKSTQTFTVKISEDATLELSPSEMEAVQRVINLINELPGDSEMIKTAREAYDELTDKQKELIPNEVYQKLLNAEEAESWLEFREKIEQITPRTFTTVLNDKYKGVNASWNFVDGIDFNKIAEIKVELCNGNGEVMAINTGNVEKLAELYNEGERIFSTPFFVEDIRYGKQDDPYWTFGEWEAKEDNKPTFAILTIEGIDGNPAGSFIHQNLSEPVNRSWEDIFKVDADRKSPIVTELSF